MVSKLTHRISNPLVTNSFYLYMAHFADYLLLLLVLPFIARALGPIALGNIGLAQTFGLLVMLSLELGKKRNNINLHKVVSICCTR